MEMVFYQQTLKSSQIPTPKSKPQKSQNTNTPRQNLKKVINSTATMENLKKTKTDERYP